MRHRDVVGHDGHVVDRRAVRAEDDEVLDVLVREADLAVHEVVPPRVALGHAKADCERHAGAHAALDLCGRQPVAAPIVLEAFLSRLGFLAALLELVRRAEASIGRVHAQQPRDVALMPLEVRALVDDVLVPIEAEPLEPLEDRAGALVGAARLVGVLDAQQELAAVLARVEPVEERRSRAADVQVAGGRGRESETRRAHGRGRRCEGERGKRDESSASRPSEERARHGEGGIRTLDRAFQPYNGLANRRLQPLGHLSRPAVAERGI